MFISNSGSVLCRLDFSSPNATKILKGNFLQHIAFALIGSQFDKHQQVYTILLPPFQNNCCPKLFYTDQEKTIDR